MQRWEYKAYNLGKLLGPGTESKFNEFGSEGWEFVAMALGPKSHYAIFKRPRT